MNKFIFLLVVIAINLSEIARANFFETKNFSASLGVEYLSLLEKRGIITYDGYQVIPIYSVNLFNPNLQLVGSSLNYRWGSYTDTLTIRARFNLDSTNDSPLYETAEKKASRVRRQGTSEVEGFIEWRPLEILELKLSLAQDVGVHKGTYAEIGARFIMANLLLKENGLAMIQPALFTNLGGGTESHNAYLYGRGAGGGLSNYAYGLSISSPAVIDTFYPVVKITRFGMVGDKVRSAQFVRANERDSWQALALAAFKIF